MKPAHITNETRDRYTSSGYWGKPTLVDLWERNALLYPYREAVVDSNRRVTWAQAKTWCDRIALGLLELGIKRDEVIASQLPNTVETLLLMRALEKAGILGLPILTTMRHSEVEYILKSVNARGMVILPEYRNFSYYQMLQDIRPKLPALEHIFVIGDDLLPGTKSLNDMAEKPLEKQYAPDYLRQKWIGPYDIRTLRTTSGTTGIPKIIEYLNSEWLIGRMDADRWKMTIEDVTLAMAPIIGGPGGGPTHWAAPHVGAKAVMMEKFDAKEALKIIERERVTIAAGVPAQMAQMVAHPDLDKHDISSLRGFFIAGAPCTYNLARQCEQTMGCKIIGAFGSLDIGRLTSASVDDPLEVRLLSVGRAYPGDEVKIVDDSGNEVPSGEVGEITWRGPTALGSYYRDLERTSKTRGGEPDGFIPTGDLGKLDEQGNIYITGRKKDLIIRGGQNISPMEIENLLFTHPKVLNVAIVPMPDPVMGEKVCAYVIPKEGMEFGFDEMVCFLKDKRIADYKLPERLEITDKFPMAGDGQKVNKKYLVEDVTRKLKADNKA